MREVIKRRREQQTERVESAKRFVQRLRSKVGKLTAWVYGSVARGTFKTWSDIDVFVVAERLPHHPLERSKLLYSCSAEGIEPKAWTMEEFVTRLKKGDKQLLAMLADRILLIDDLSLEGVLQAKLRANDFGTQRSTKNEEGGTENAEEGAK